MHSPQKNQPTPVKEQTKNRLKPDQHISTMLCRSSLSLFLVSFLAGHRWKYFKNIGLIEQIGLILYGLLVCLYQLKLPLTIELVGTNNHLSLMRSQEVANEWVSNITTKNNLINT